MLICMPCSAPAAARHGKVHSRPHNTPLHNRLREDVYCWHKQPNAATNLSSHRGSHASSGQAWSTCSVTRTSLLWPDCCLCPTRVQPTAPLRERARFEHAGLPRPDHHQQACKQGESRYHRCGAGSKQQHQQCLCSGVQHSALCALSLRSTEGLGSSSAP